MGKKTKPLAMSVQQRDRLESWVRAKTTPQRVVFRSQICLLAADGLSATAIADRMNTSRPTVMVWKKRFEAHGPDGLAQDAPRGPSPRRLDEATRKAIVDAATNTPPAEGGHWTTRTLAKALGISNASVARVWRACGIKGRGKKNGKRAKEKDSEKRVSELLGIYVHPPVRAIVVGEGRNSHLPSLSPTESHQEALAQCFGGLLQPQSGECGSCLSAALALLENVSTDALTNGDALVGLLAFLENVERETARDVKLHVLVEEPGRKFPSRLDQWGKNHPRMYVHIFPHKCFTQNDISEIIGSITGEIPFQGGPESVVGLVGKIDQFVRAPQETSQPFTWIRNQSLLSAGPGLCKGILETMKQLGSIMTTTLRLNSAILEAMCSQGEDTMNWKQKFESWFAAVAFAEADEHETARQIASTAIPEAREAAAVLPSLRMTFAAAAFAEENCHDVASELLFGKEGKRSFLDAVGLESVRVWYGTASSGQTFAESVGLAGARFKLVTIPL